MTGSQVRAARQLLGWSAARLAAQCDVPEGAIIRFERFNRMPKAYWSDHDRVGAVRAAMEAVGVEFGKARSVWLRRPMNAAESIVTREFTNGDASGILLRGIEG